MLVVALIGVLAGAVAFSLAGQAQHQSRHSVIAAIAQADKMARIASRRLGRAVMLRLDLDEQRVDRLVDAGSESVGHALMLSKQVQMDRIILPRASTTGSGRFDLSDWTKGHGVVEIACVDGRSASYAVALAGESVDQPTWLVFSGLTGQMTVIHHEEEIHNLFALLARRPDAD